LIKSSPPERTLLQLKDVLADVLALAQRELAERHITTRAELPEDLPLISGDRVELQQVLLNLVINASDAMSALPEERRMLTINGWPEELEGRPAAMIAVRDLGHGFDAADAERLFDAFYTSKAHGMGMGLRISRSIVERHGGRLWATVNEQGGATFICVLPGET
jgi:C4-dicarboxylate-specific signal transduction histidine kinase